MIDVSIHPDRVGDQSFSNKWKEYLEKRGANVRMVDLYRDDWIEQISGSDGVMWRCRLKNPDRIFAPIILQVIERELGIPVYPDNIMRWPWNDKVRQSLLFKAHGIRTPRTWIFWDREDALRWANSASYPVVFKLSLGAASSNVILVEDRSSACELIERSFTRGIESKNGLDEYRETNIFGKLLTREKRRLSQVLKRNFNYETLEKGYVYFQEFVPSEGFDYRVDHIHGKLFASRRMNRPDDFRASGGGDEENDPKGIPLSLLRTAADYARKLRMGCVAFDFLTDEKGPVLLEMGWTSPDRPIHDCPGHWNEKLEWIEGNIWPEEIQVDFFLNRIKEQG